MNERRLKFIIALRSVFKSKFDNVKHMLYEAVFGSEKTISSSENNKINMNSNVYIM